MPDFDVRLTPAAEAGLVRISDGRLTIEAVPQSKPTQTLRAQVFVGQADGLYVAPVQSDFDAEGILTLDAPVRDWFPEPGRYSVHIALMPADRQLAIVGDRLVDRHLGQAGVRWLSWPVAYRAGAR
jgi:hypothetical protein